MALPLRDGLLLMSASARVGRLSLITNHQFFSSSFVLHQALNQPAKDAPLKSISEVPGPPIFPIIGSVFPLSMYKGFNSQEIHKFWKKAMVKYGDIVRMDSPGRPKVVALAHPEDCETLLRSTMENPIRPTMQSLKKVRQQAADDYFEGKTGLITENGEEWKRVRNLVQAPMMKAENVNKYLPQMDQVTLEFMDRISSLQKQHGEMPEDFQVELYKLGLETIGLVAMNQRMGCLNPNLSTDAEPMKLIHSANLIFESLGETEMNSSSWKWYESAPFKSLKKAHNEFLRIADERIKETETELKGKKYKSEEDLNLMDILLLTPGLSHKDVVTLILDMLIAGIDTTSHTIGFILYLLARNKQCQEKLQNELDTVLGNHRGTITPSHMAELSYLKAVVKESLRLFPLTPGVGRLLDKDIAISGYMIPKGFTVFALTILMSQDERFFPQPDEFIPDRWLRHRPLGPIHPYASLPFGTGTRMCIGRRIAEQEIYMFIARAMQRFTVDYKYEDIEAISKLMFVPSKPLKFSFTERISAEV